MNWNRRKALPDWEKRRIRNRHEKYLRKEKEISLRNGSFGTGDNCRRDCRADNFGRCVNERD